MNADATGAYLSQVNLVGANLRLADLPTANMWNSDLRGADLGESDLRGAMLSDSNLEGASLDDADLFNANLERCKLSSASLRDTNMQGAMLYEAVLIDADLSGTNLFGANLESCDLTRALLKDVNLQAANLEDANLTDAKLELSNLVDANLEDANLTGVTLQKTNLLNANFGVRGIESIGEFEDLETALDVYRALKVSHQRGGLYERAGLFFYLESNVSRRLTWKNLSISPRSFNKLSTFFWLTISWAVNGYGEKPIRVMVWVVGLVVIPPFGYWFGHAFGGGWDAANLGKSLYFSAASVVALGYGPWVSEPVGPVGWAQTVGVIQTFFGIFLLALLLVTTTRKLSR